MHHANIATESRLEAVEILLREMQGWTLARRGIIDRIAMQVDALEREAVLAGDDRRRAGLAEVRAALTRLTE